MRSKRGITLVSLVVTIIVLIILAGVSINLTLGENGIITMAKKARENMELATIEEETKLNALYTQIELEDGNIGGIDSNSISKLIEFKQKVASAITDMGVETLETANADTMASNIRSISTNKDAASVSYDNTNSELSSTNVQEAVDEINDSLKWKYIAVNEPVNNVYNYVLSDEVSSANEIEVYCGIPTINASKQWQPVIPGVPVGFCYGERQGNYYVEICIYLANDRSKLIVPVENVIGWESGTMSLISIRYR